MRLAASPAQRRCRRHRRPRRTWKAPAPAADSRAASAPLLGLCPEIQDIRCFAARWEAHCGMSRPAHAATIQDERGRERSPALLNAKNRAKDVAAELRTIELHLGR